MAQLVTALSWNGQESQTRLSLKRLKTRFRKGKWPWRCGEGASEIGSQYRPIIVLMWVVGDDTVLAGRGMTNDTRNIKFV